MIRTASFDLVLNVLDNADHDNDLNRIRMVVLLFILPQDMHTGNRVSRPGQEILNEVPLEHWRKRSVHQTNTFLVTYAW